MIIVSFKKLSEVFRMVKYEKMWRCFIVGESGILNYMYLLPMMLLFVNARKIITEL
jgi:hypothetical protein